MSTNPSTTSSSSSSSSSLSSATTSSTSSSIISPSLDFPDEDVNVSTPDETVETKLICKHWIRNGSCFFKKDCKFKHLPRSHVQLIEAIDSLQKKQKKNSRKQNADGSLKSCRRQRNDTNQNAKFRRWLIDVFGREVICRDSIIIDVGGGNGELVYELTNLNYCRCVSIDPRPTRYELYERKLLRGHCHHNAYFQHYNDNKEIPTSVDEIYDTAPVRLRCFLLPEFFDETLTRAERQLAFQKSCRRAFAIDWTELGLVEHESNELMQSRKDNRAKPMLFSETVLAAAVHDNEHNNDDELNDDKTQPAMSFEEFETTINDAALLVGCHCDQAAEFLVDLALKKKKPFAVVPCCVYKNSFKRCLKNGQPVSSYEDLLIYLCEKHEKIQRTTVTGMRGKNQAVFMLQKDY